MNSWDFPSFWPLWILLLWTILHIFWCIYVYIYFDTYWVELLCYKVLISSTLVECVKTCTQLFWLVIVYEYSMCFLKECALRRCRAQRDTYFNWIKFVSHSSNFLYPYCFFFPAFSISTWLSCIEISLYMDLSIVFSYILRQWH